MKIGKIVFAILLGLSLLGNVALGTKVADLEHNVDVAYHMREHLTAHAVSDVGGYVPLDFEVTGYGLGPKGELQFLTGNVTIDSLYECKYKESAGYGGPYDTDGKFSIKWDCGGNPLTETFSDFSIDKYPTVPVMINKVSVTEH